MTQSCLPMQRTCGARKGSVQESVTSQGCMCVFAFVHVHAFLGCVYIYIYMKICVRVFVWTFMCSLPSLYPCVCSCRGACRGKFSPWDLLGLRIFCRQGDRMQGVARPCLCPRVCLLATVGTAACRNRHCSAPGRKSWIAFAEIWLPTLPSNLVAAAATASAAATLVKLGAASGSFRHPCCRDPKVTGRKCALLRSEVSFRKPCNWPWSKRMTSSWPGCFEKSVSGRRHS